MTDRTLLLDDLAERMKNLPEDRREAARELLDDLAERRAMTLAQMAERYCVSTKTLQREIQRGNLSAMKLGRYYRVTPAQARAWEATRSA